MEILAENFGGDIELNSQNESLSIGEDHSNALILPAKKEKKKKGMNEGRGKTESNKKQKLSKSQKRKLKKLEEEKEKEHLLTKSMENFNQSRIPEYAYPLLLSSCNINRAETLREKRRRVVHLLKEGLEVCHSDEPSKKLGISRQIEPDIEMTHLVEEFEEDDIIQPIRIESEDLNTTYAPLESSQGPERGKENIENSGSLAPCLADFSLEKKEASISDGIKNSSLALSSNDGRKGIQSMDKTDENPNGNLSKMSKHQDFSRHRPSATPTVVHVNRPTVVEDKRKDLPIVMMEQEIMEAINEHSTVIICGETGCGKTTQVPQFLYEAGFGSSKSTIHSGIIGVTQPRRVAVLATAKRVAFELGLHLGKEVGFQVRYDKKVGDRSSIKFMTDGILLREVQNDILLRRYSVIILDEAHERSLNTDILIGMLTRVIRLRQEVYNKQQQQMTLSGENISPENMIFPLKLVLMSATLRVQDFISGRLFPTPPPVVEVPTRQFPVTVHFSKRTEIVDYIGQAYKKILAIHKRLPPGGILVFVTGQREVEYLCKKLHKASRELIMKKSIKSVENDGTMAQEADSTEEINMKEISEAFEIHGSSASHQTDRFSSYDENGVDEGESDFSYNSETESELEFDDDVNLEDSQNNGNLLDVLGEDGSLASMKAAFEKLSGQAQLSTNSDGEQTSSMNTESHLDQSKIPKEKKTNQDSCSSPGALFVLPLYAMLPAAAQLRVFGEVKEGERLVVVATNVAETSLTIPGIKYVVDTGREKVKNYNSSNGMEAYEVQWISKASAAQRAGRAGRTGPGHCYRLYSSAVFNNILPDFSLAEVSKVPVHGVVLILKSMHIKKVANFPFPTPPNGAALVEAENCLKVLEALNDKDELTPLGKSMAVYPLSPRHSRMLLTVIKITRHEQKCNRPSLLLAYAVAAAAALSLINPFIMQFEGNDTNRDQELHENSGLVNSEKVLDQKEKLTKKKLKETAKVAREKFRILTSDALTIAYALQCFEQSQRPVEFCDENALHFKTMDEMSKLRQQLLKLVFYQNTVGVVEQEFSWIHGTLEDVEQAWRVPSSKFPLSLDEEQLIRQGICAGWADRVARRISGSSKTSDGEKITHLIRYQSCTVEEIVFLHRWSAVSVAAPEFLVYNELLQTKRPYMHGVTAVEPAWLVDHTKSSCIFSAPLTDPKPFYDTESDQVKCWVTPTFGRFCWELPKHQMRIGNDEYRIQVFAYALLEGQVCPCLKSVRKFMAAPSETILKREAFGQKRVGNLLSKLKSRLIDSSAMLRMVWKENPKELFSEILDWFQQSFHKNFQQLWLQMLNEVLLETQERSLSTRVKKKLKGKSKLLK
ncbi:hypothetical protein L6164_003715 [Bauhinia variegata]|uniref:Uncharacterized protein n=1 Tax=Bauhinia variegata TaxID=167791 RepID=A0ACB9Q7P0_BAUVA|nr:hypothetical protein L6164_003715 [Bauhinia variegata]